jgi:hypothetical protein
MKTLKRVLWSLSAVMLLAPVPSRNENRTTWGKRREKRVDDPASTVRSQSLHCSF